mgnify:CR=1 FL=1
MNSLGEVVNNAMQLIEDQSEQLTGVLPKSYTDFSDEILSELLRIFNNSALDEIGGDIILHAYHSVGMMMVGNDGYHQHYQADEKKNIGYVLFLFHSSIFGRMQR